MKIRSWQLFDEQGQPIPTNGAPKHEVVVRGLLHGASHVWIWRRRGDSVELLLQKRAALKVNWPNLLDKSAGGHIAFAETPLEAALRKVKDELGLELSATDLQLAGNHRWRAAFSEGSLIENEFQFIYLAEVEAAQLAPAEREVQGTVWKLLDELRSEAINDRLAEKYVPYGKDYYQLLSEAVARIVANGQIA